MNAHSSSTYRLIPGIGLGDSLLFLPAAFALARSGHKVIMHSHWLNSFKDKLPFSLEFPINYQSSPEDLKSFSHEKIIIQNHSPASSLLKGRDFQIVGRSKFEGRTQAAEIFESFLLDCDLSTTLCDLRALLLEKTPLIESRTLALHPLSHDCLKNWPLEKFLSLASYFAGQGWRLYVFGSKRDASQLKAFEEMATIYIDLPIKDLLLELSKKEIFVGNDSGLGHLASLANCPTFSLFKSRSHAKLWRPSWSYNSVITPCLPLPGVFRDRLWKSTLFPKQIIHSIDTYLKHPFQRVV